jgi:serine/threonine-protein kinase
LASLQHPNLLPLFDSGDGDGFLYCVMPYVEGDTLRDRLAAEGQLPVDETIRLIALMAGALDFAHARGVIHRDLKPENVLLQAGQPIIADSARAGRRASGRRTRHGDGAVPGHPALHEPGAGGRHAHRGRAVGPVRARCHRL